MLAHFSRDCLVNWENNITFALPKSAISGKN